MRNKVIILMMGLLLIGVNAFAAGDLIVKNKLAIGSGAGIASNTINAQESASSNQYQAVRAVTLWSPSIGVNYMVGINGFNAINSSTFDPGSTSKGLSFKNTSTGGPWGSSNLDIYGMEVLGFGDGGTNMTAGTIFGIYTVSSTSVLGGNVSADNLYGMYVKAPSASGTLTVTGTNAGIWLENMNKNNPAGSPDNYGIVLDGDGVGSDIVFKPSVPAEKTRLYSNAGRLYAHDSFGNATILSPHDPKTGEWIYYSKNIKTGKTVRVDMERLVKAVEKLTGETFMIETLAE